MTKSPLFVECVSLMLLLRSLRSSGRYQTDLSVDVYVNLPIPAFYLLNSRFHSHSLDVVINVWGLLKWDNCTKY